MISLTSGYELLFKATQIPRGKIIEAHLTSSLFVAAFFILHLLIYFRKMDSSKKKNRNAQSARTIIIYSLIFSSPAVIYGTYAALAPEPNQEAAVTPYSLLKQGNPFYPSETTTPLNRFVPESSLVQSKRCASCHNEIYKQWQDSSHRLAAADPSYVKNINLLEKNKGIEYTRYCEGCHAPVALLTGNLTQGGAHGGVENTSAFEEGINCIACHNITTINHNHGVGSYHLDPRSDIGTESDSMLYQAINNLAVSSSSKIHKDNFSSDSLSQSSFCASCHEQFMDSDMNNWGWVKMQSVYIDWLNSPYSFKRDYNPSEGVQRCQSCHMQKTYAPNDPSADSQGMVASHRFIGSNTFLAESSSKHQFDATEAFISSNKLSISIKPPFRKNPVQGIMNNQTRSENRNTFYYYLGEEASIDISVSNIGVGHSFPAGTTDLNQAWIELAVQDAAGRLIYSSGKINGQGYLEKDAYQYRSIPIDKEGKDVWRHDLFNMIGERYRNTIKAGESDIASFNFSIPYWSLPPIQITATLKWRKFNRKYSEWVLGKDHDPLPITDLARDTLEIPILREKPAF